ncbi:MAG: hypothetical protein KDJ73_10680 [Notoacmeibacter sp.]|nr:hypothetical protein [Notoacmeibacter sp.]MCC0032936.1 hypothetical protein [Brucellaceae bacterium]
MTKQIGERAGKAIQDNHPELISFGGISGLTAMDIFSFDSFATFSALTVAVFSSIFLSYRRNNKITERVNHISTLEAVIRDGHRNFYDVWDDKAREIYQELTMDVKSRLTIYKFDNEIKKFRLLGRYSDNAEFRERRRDVYPPDQGVIGKAWSSGECYVKALPNPVTNWDKYADENLKFFGIPRDVLEKIRMKSTCFYAFTLRDDRSIPFAIILIESVKRDSIDRQKIDQKFENGHAREISAMIKSLAFMEPSLRAAQDLGL